MKARLPENPTPLARWLWGQMHAYAEPMTLGSVAVKIGTSTMAVKRVIDGDKTSLQTLEALAVGFEVDRDWIVEVAGDQLERRGRRVQQEHRRSSDDLPSKVLLHLPEEQARMPAWISRWLDELKSHGIPYEEQADALRAAMEYAQRQAEAGASPGDISRRRETDRGVRPPNHPTDGDEPPGYVARTDGRGPPGGGTV